MANEDRVHLAFVRLQPCCLCGRRGPSQAHHAGPRGLGTRVHDWMAVPLCDPCHDGLHDSGGAMAARPALMIAIGDILTRRGRLLKAEQEGRVVY